MLKKVLAHDMTLSLALTCSVLSVFLLTVAAAATACATPV